MHLLIDLGLLWVDRVRSKKSARWTQCGEDKWWSKDYQALQNPPVILFDCSNLLKVMISASILLSSYSMSSPHCPILTRPKDEKGFWEIYFPDLVILVPIWPQKIQHIPHFCWHLVLPGLNFSHSGGYSCTSLYFYIKFFSGQ